MMDAVLRMDPPGNRATLQRQTFRTSRLLDFFSEKELVAQTGHTCAIGPLVVVKELIDNALDACEEAGIAPVISVTVDEAGIEVTDNGPGLPADTIKGVLDYTVRVSSREAYVRPTRGAQGNALKTIVGMPFALDPRIGTVLEIDANGVRHVINCAVDHIRQEPVIEHLTEPGIRRNGTSVLVRWPDSPSSNLLDAEDRFLQITDDFTWLNPHLTLTTEFVRRSVPRQSDGSGLGQVEAIRPDFGALVSARAPCSPDRCLPRARSGSWPHPHRPRVCRRVPGTERHRQAEGSARSDRLVARAAIRVRQRQRHRHRQGPKPSHRHAGSFEAGEAAGSRRHRRRALQAAL